MHHVLCFFYFNWLKILRRFHFFVLEHSQMKSDGRTVCTMVTLCMNTEGPLVIVGKENKK